MNIHSKKPTNVTIRQDILKEARDLNINVSKAAEKGLELEIRAIKQANWKRENAQSIAWANEWYDKNGEQYQGLASYKI